MATTKKKAAKKAAAKAPAKKTAPKKATPKKAVQKKAAPAKAAAPKATTVNSYLSFNGNCEQAFNFYKSVFGGSFTFIGRYKDMPPQQGHPPVPASEAKKIMHVSLPISGETILMGCDIAAGMGYTHTAGNNFSLSVNTSSRQEADRIFKALSKGGKVTMPMGDMFWGSYFGMLVDKFGMAWMVSYGQM